MDLFYSVLTSEGDEDGKFNFTGVAPGEYRVLAVSLDAKGKLDGPKVRERLLTGVEKLTLGARASQHLSLKLTEP